jgi:Zn-dependent M28 family amino/carboxypeptidase
MRKTTAIAASGDVTPNFAGGETANTGVVQITGTFVGTLSFEATVDGTNYVPVAAEPVAGGASVTSATGPGLWRIRAGGFHSLRVRCSAFTSGAPVVTTDVEQGTL